jgi:hypothetical protein
LYWKSEKRLRSVSVKLEFTAEDFRAKDRRGVQFVGEVECFQEIADMANDRLEEMLAQAPVVYSIHPHLWGTNRNEFYDIKMGKVIDIVDIKPIEESGG